MASSLVPSTYRDSREIVFVHELPYEPRKKICSMLNQHDAWKDLAGKWMKYDANCIEDMARDRNPADYLLQLWGTQNHTVAELFVLLYKMQHFLAMKELKPFVDKEHHQLIYEGERNISRLLRSGIDNQSCGQLEGSGGKMDVDPLNLNYGELRVSLPTKDLHVAAAVNGAASPEEKIVNVASLSPPDWNTLQRSHPATQDLPHPNVQGRLPQVTGARRKSSGGGAVGMSEASTCVVGGGDRCSSAVSVPHIPFQELVQVTNGWDKSRMLGKGGFGTVFRGSWKNTEVAIKKMEQKSGGSEASQQAHLQQSLEEMRFLNSYRHDNILPLYGVSVDVTDSPCLVYQFMPNGSLEDRLLCRHKSQPLSWQQRLAVSVGTSRGLQFLHAMSPSLIHGDVKSANILLDRNLDPKLGDFGLAREGPPSQYTHMKVSRVHGTRPYLPDEYLRSKKSSTKVDVFSFGIVLYEVATGQRAYEERRDTKFLKDLVESSVDSPMRLDALMDQKAPQTDGNAHSIFKGFVTLGCTCVRKNHRERPEMVQVMKELDVLTANFGATSPGGGGVGIGARKLSPQWTTTQRKVTPTTPPLSMGGASVQTASTWLSPGSVDDPGMVQGLSPTHPVPTSSPKFACFPSPQQSFVVAPSPTQQALSPVGHPTMGHSPFGHSPLGNFRQQMAYPCFPTPMTAYRAPVSPVSPAEAPIPVFVQSFQSATDDSSAAESVQGVVPLITALGIKDDPPEESASGGGMTSSGSARSGEVRNTAKGKTLSFLQNT